MTNYQQGKIYKIEAVNGDENDKIYIRSTCKKYLSQRMQKHRSQYNLWKEGKRRLTTSFNLFDKHGVDNCRIVLIELVPCNSKDELFSREAFHIKTKNTINKCIPLKTDKEYYQDNIEKIKIYQAEHAEEIKERKKIKYQENKEKTKENKKEKIFGNVVVYVENQILQNIKKHRSI